MTSIEIQTQALSNARNNQALTNYPAIFSGFLDKGIAEAEILPRVNVFTFHAWKALGRSVRKGEHGVKVCTFVPIAAKVDATTGIVVRSAGRAPRMTTVFHISQTQEGN